jgi:hypothetical protein
MKKIVSIMTASVISAGITYYFSNYIREPVKDCVANRLEIASVKADSFLFARQNNSPVPIKSTLDLNLKRETVTSAVSKNVTKKSELPVDQPNLQESVDALAATNRRANEFNHYLAELLKTKENNLLDDMEKKFAAEAVDIEWSYDYAEKIQQLFRSSDDLSRIYPETIQCKTSRCKINIPASSTEQANRISEVFMRAITNTDSAINSSVLVTAHDDVHGTISLYVARGGDVILFQ